MDAALSGLRGSEAAVLEKLLQSTAQTPQRETAITMLAATIVRGAQDAAVQNLFAWVADDEPAGLAAVGAAARRGGRAARRGVPAPGGRRARRRRGGRAARRRRVRPVRAARGGPGGAYAFADAVPGGRAPGRARHSGGAAAGRARRAARRPRPAAEPRAGRRSSGWPRGGDLGARDGRAGARGVARQAGRRGAGRAADADEQERFDAGQEVYKNICQACHQPDGRGQEKVAPSLVGSALALAPAEVTARILLNGKEGPIGLMPPVGSVLTDDQIAAVLTYIRREWGQAGTPVDPATVKSVRALTAGRTRPWTNDERLLASGVDFVCVATPDDRHFDAAKAGHRGRQCTC